MITNTKDKVFAIYHKGKLITRVYSKKVLYYAIELIDSCFGSGSWFRTKGWKRSDGWKRN